MHDLELKEAIRICTETIKEAQRDDGGFLHSSWPAESYEDILPGGTTTFFTANILNCLNVTIPMADFDSVIRIRKRAARFLSAQKSGYGSFNYWANGSPEKKTMPYPDDLDDTSVALAALHGFDGKDIDGGMVANIIKLLTAVEAAPGGPYRTWLIKPEGHGAESAWQDIDLVVNSNIAYLLSRYGISLKNIDIFIEDRIQSGSLFSPYYPGVMQVIYFISRCYHGSDRLRLRDVVLSEENYAKHEIWKNLLETAMAISSLLAMGFPDQLSYKTQRYFLEQISMRQFGPFGFCMDPVHEGKSCLAGSRSLTAAFCLEALGRLATIGREKKKSDTNKSKSAFLPSPSARLKK